MAAYKSLLSPLTIRGRTFRNRVLSTSHAPCYTENGMPGERYQAYHEEKARGGIGLTMFGGSSTISREAGSIHGRIYVGSDDIIPVFRQFAKRIHRHGAALMCQITHMGRRTGWAGGDWLPTMAPSPIRDPAHHSVPYEMSARDIARVTRDFAEAALRCREGGLDGCEILTTTHLLGQFLSPLSNKRTDAYGGALENRVRFILEVVEAARERVGDDFILGVRFAADESNEGGLPPEEGIAVAKILGEQGAADFLNVNGAYGGTDHGLAENVPGMAFKSAPYIELARRVKEASGLPTFQAARLSDPATADWAIAQGLVDMAGLTRPHIADPHLVRKLLRGEETRIRPCVGAGFCIDRAYAGKDSLCVQNASTGRETSLPHEIARATHSKRVTVIGGGPAGMEAARICALRGHDVTLHEAGARLGGQILLAARAGWRKDMIGIADWLASEIETLHVDVRLGSWIDGPEVLEDAPDTVIVATGGVPDTALPEGGGEFAATTWDVLSGNAPALGDVLIYDETGGHGGISTADFLAAQGARIELATPDHFAGLTIGGQNLPIYLRNLYRCSARLTPDHRLLSIRRDGNGLVATLWNDYARAREERHVAQVIVERCTLPADGPFKALKDRSRNLGEIDAEKMIAVEAQPEASNPNGAFSLFRIGDALASRDIHAAILDANRLCRTF
jgi:2,4-dienoyl-CoA reductase-like NADH-dependent reductase (Old Yellow Enzyme family)